MDQLIVALVNAVVVPIATVIPFLASSGLLLLAFLALWVGFAAAWLRDPARLEAAWNGLRHRSLPIQAVAWLLVLPVLVGLWVWRRPWPAAARALVIAGIAGWNILVFLPSGV